MDALTPYLTFNGNCREAMEFYQRCLGGKMETMQSFGESPVEIADEHKNRIMHAHLAAGAMQLMASDSMPDQPFESGSQVSISIQINDPDAVSPLFDKLSEGGTVTMPVSDTFWGARFGMLKDRFGISWMLNCQMEPHS